MDIQQRVLQNSIRDEKGCLLWQGFPDKFGYGRIRTGGGKRPVVHRAIWEEIYGSIEKDLKVCHKCDVPNCCEISHLFLGTSAENSADMVKKGRSLPGESNPEARLSWAQVNEIREMYAAGNISQKKLGDFYGVKQTTVSGIVLHKIWKAGS